MKRLDCGQIFEDRIANISIASSENRCRFVKRSLAEILFRTG
jgi:hypothetical protein